MSIESLREISREETDIEIIGLSGVMELTVKGIVEIADYLVRQHDERERHLVAPKSQLVTSSPMVAGMDMAKSSGDATSINITVSASEPSFQDVEKITEEFQEEIQRSMSRLSLR